MLTWMDEIWMKSHLASDGNATLSIYEAQILFTKMSESFFGLHLVLVTLHGRFTINVEQDK